MNFHGLTITEQLDYLSQGEIPDSIHTSQRDNFLVEFGRLVTEHIEGIINETQEEVDRIESELADERRTSYGEGYDEGYEDGYNKGCSECTGGE